MSSHLDLKCQKCEHTWAETLPTPMLLDAFVARLRAISRICPYCGYKPLSKSKEQIVLMTGQAELAEGDQG